MKKSTWHKLLYVLVCIPQLIWADEFSDSLRSAYYSNRGKPQAVKALVALSNYYTRSEFDSAIYYAKLIFKETNDLRQHAKANRLLGFSYFNKSNFKTAFSHYLKAAEYYESQKNDTLLMQVYNNIGQLFYYNNNKKSAKDYWIKALNKGRKINHLSIVSDLLNNLGAVCWDEGNIQKAIEYYDESSKIDLKKKDYASYAASLSNIALAYTKLYDETNNKSYRQLSQKYYLDAYRIIDTLPMTVYTIPLLLSISDAMMDFKKHHFASVIIKRAEEKEAGTFSKDHLRLLQLKARLLAEMKKPAEAFEVLQRYVELKDSLVEAESNTQLIETEAKYQNVQKERAIDMQKLALEKKDLKLQQSKWVGYFLGSGFLLIMILAFVTYKRYREKQKANKLISLQKEEVEFKNKIIEEKQKEIIDSISYARRIQYTILPQAQLIQKHLENYFILFQPKDIVSGDFYWATSVESGHSTRFYLAVCDSTGHGVPGAFMSLLSVGFLSEAINEKRIYEPHEVFNYVRNRLIENISREGQRDGFDGVLLCFQKKEGTEEIYLSYAAANKAPVLVTDFAIRELKHDRMPVGIEEKMESFNLYNHTLKKGDTLYLYTDGYADQFGGPRGKKFMAKNLKQLLLECSSLPIGQQQQILEDAFIKWKGNLEQVDDVTLVGIRI